MYLPVWIYKFGSWTCTPQCPQVHRHKTCSWFEMSLLDACWLYGICRTFFFSVFINIEYILWFWSKRAGVFFLPSFWYCCSSIKWYYLLHAIGYVIETSHVMLLHCKFVTRFLMNFSLKSYERICVIERSPVVGVKMICNHNMFKKQ